MKPTHKLTLTVLIVLLSFTAACSPEQTEVIANAVPTQMQAPVETAMAPVSTAVAAVTGPTHPNLPEYPVGGGAAPAGIYQAPTLVVPTQWFPMPDYPDNSTMVNPWGDNPANCGMQSDWEFCSHAFFYMVSIMGPNSSVGMTVKPSNADGYMLIEGAVNGDSQISTYESQSLAISDGTTAFVIRMTAQWPVDLEHMEFTSDAYYFEIGFVP